LKNAIQTEERRIADAYANEYQVAAAREAELASSAAKLFGGSDATSELRELESTAETLRNLYNNTLQKFKETNTIEPAQRLDGSGYRTC
jgi:succinoglycan biosynthesis transport protein ExoP